MIKGHKGMSYKPWPHWLKGTAVTSSLVLWIVLFYGCGFLAQQECPCLPLLIVSPMALFLNQWETGSNSFLNSMLVLC